jgi:hypothetical protein
LSRTADEWFALLILLRAGRFADEHDFRVGIAHPKNGLSTRAGKMRALCATANAFANGAEHLCLGRCRLL